MKILAMIIGNLLKLSLFFFIIILVVSPEKIYLPLIPILQLAMMILSGTQTIFFIVCYWKNYDHPQVKILLKVIGSSMFELILLGLAFCYFWIYQVINMVGLFWLIPFFATIYLCLPSSFNSSSKKRNT